jgi:hypothetical protein
MKKETEVISEEKRIQEEMINSIQWNIDYHEKKLNEFKIQKKLLLSARLTI